MGPTPPFPLASSRRSMPDARVQAINILVVDINKNNRSIQKHGVDLKTHQPRGQPYLQGQPYLHSPQEVG